MDCTRFPMKNAGAPTDVSNRNSIDSLITFVLFNTVIFSYACQLGGTDNMIACLIVNLITNSIANIGAWVEFIYIECTTFLCSMYSLTLSHA